MSKDLRYPSISYQRTFYSVFDIIFYLYKVFDLRETKHTIRVFWNELPGQIIKLSLTDKILYITIWVSKRVQKESKKPEIFYRTLVLTEVFNPYFLDFTKSSNTETTNQTRGRKMNQIFFFRFVLFCFFRFLPFIRKSVFLSILKTKVLPTTMETRLKILFIVFSS